MKKQGMRDRVFGCFLGTAIGDALGMPFEATSRKDFPVPGFAVSGYYDPPRNHRFYGGKLTAGI